MDIAYFSRENVLIKFAIIIKMCGLNMMSSSKHNFLVQRRKILLKSFFFLLLDIIES